jgi:hypothetical protein
MCQYKEIKMANMSYCRFENTCLDLRDCLKNWDSATSDTEIMYRKEILDLAKEIVEYYGEEDDYEIY